MDIEILDDFYRFLRLESEILDDLYGFLRLESEILDDLYGFLTLESEKLDDLYGFRTLVLGFCTSRTSQKTRKIWAPQRSNCRGKTTSWDTFLARGSK